MVSKILEKIITRRKGHYVHALEVQNVYELEFVIDELVREFKEEYTKKDILDFFVGMSIYYLEPEAGADEKEEYKIYQFNIENYINNNFELV